MSENPKLEIEKPIFSTKDTRDAENQEKTLVFVLTVASKTAGKIIAKKGKKEKTERAIGFLEDLNDAILVVTQLCPTFKSLAELWGINDKFLMQLYTNESVEMAIKEGNYLGCE